MSAHPKSSLVRIFNKNGAIVGAGFLVSERHVMTCAHVAAKALNLPDTTLDAPGEDIHFDFPLIAPNLGVKARVVFWLPVRSSDLEQPDGNEDIAVLEVTSSLSQGCRPALFAAADAQAGLMCQTFGLPEGFDKGVPASGVISGSIAGGCQVLEDMKTVGYFAKRGFSGAPVWND